MTNGAGMDDDANAAFPFPDSVATASAFLSVLNARARRFLQIVLGPALLGLTALLALGGCGSAFPSSARGNAVAQREDLAAFERGFLAVDRSFSPDARAKANERLAALSADAGTISDTRFVLALSEIAALADNGHTGVIYRGSAADLGRVGIRVAPFGQDFVVLQA